MKNGYYIKEPRYKFLGDTLSLDISKSEFECLHQLNIPEIQRDLDFPYYDKTINANATKEFFNELIPSEYIKSGKVDCKAFNENSKCVLEKLFWVKLYSREAAELGEEWFFVETIALFTFDEYKDKLDADQQANGDYLVRLLVKLRTESLFQEYSRYNNIYDENNQVIDVERVRYGYRIREDYEWPALTFDEMQALDRFGWNWGVGKIGVENGVDFFASLKRNFADAEATMAFESLAKKYPDKFAVGFCCEKRQPMIGRTLAPGDPDNYNFSFKVTFYDFARFGVVEKHTYQVLDELNNYIAQRLVIRQARAERNKEIAEKRRKSESQNYLWWAIMLILAVLLAVMCS